MATLLTRLLFEEEEQEFGEHILHIEDMKPHQLLAFLKQWNIDPTIEVTEKMDGFFMRFGVDDSGFFMGTKHMTWHSQQEIGDLFFFEDMKRYFGLLQSVPVAQLVAKVLKTKTLPRSVVISGEGIPAHDYNIVIYDQSKVGNGVFVIYQVTVDGKQITDTKTLNTLANALGGSTEVKFFANRLVDLSSFRVPQKVIVNLEKLLTKHADVLKAPATTPEAKQIKQQVSELVKGIGTTVKSQMLAVPYSPMLGGDIEGYVVKLPNGQLVKIVDKNKFTASKKLNWKYMGDLQTAERAFKVVIRRDPSQLPQALDDWESKVNAVEADYAATGQQTIQIQRKHRDTVESIKLAKRTIAALRGLLKTTSPEVAVQKFLGHQLIREGGHAVAGVNSKVPREALESTVASALKTVGLDPTVVDHDVVGNVNKSMLGDVDVALDLDDVRSVWNLPQDSKEFWRALDRKLATLGVPFKVNVGLAQFHVLTPLTDRRGNHLDSTDEDRPGYVQVDFFLGNREWMRNVLSGSPSTSRHKAVVRNLFLSSIVGSIPTDDPNTKYVMDYRNGVQLTKYTTTPKKVASRKVFVADADKLANWLFGKSWTDVASFESMYQAFMSPSFKFPKIRQVVLDKLKTMLDEQGIALPSELQEQTTLGSLLFEEHRQTIGLIPGAFKPPHVGHWSLIERASRECDRVIVFASTGGRDKGGFNLDGARVVEYWKRFLFPVLPANVEVRLTNVPMKDMVDTLVAANESPNDHNSYVIYAGADDIADRQKIVSRTAPGLVAQNRVEFREIERGTAAVSGTRVRQALGAGDVATFARFLPAPVRGKAPQIFKVLTGE